MKGIPITRTLLATLLLGISIVSSYGQSANGSDTKAEQEILRLLDEVQVALVKRDAAVIERICTDDYYTVYDAGAVGDRTRLINSLKAPNATFGWDDWKRVDAKIKFHGDTAIVLCRFLVKAHNPQGSFDQDYRSIAVWVKQREQWKLSASQFTIIKPPAPPAK